MDHLDALSKELEVSSLSSFYDYSELGGQYGGEIEGFDAQQLECWFDPAPCLGAVKAISQYLSERPERLDFSHHSGRKHWRPRLVQELKDCESTLEDALARGHRFRFLIVP
jgi:hypothetical protein